MSQSYILNYQSSLALTETVVSRGAFPTPDGVGTDTFLGEIDTFAFNFAPSATAVSAAGQMVPIASNTALFSILGTNFGGTGQTTFGIPDLAGTTMIGAGASAGLPAANLGISEGTQSTTLTRANVPADIGGSSAPVDNYQPSLPVTYMICAYGLYPSQGGGGSSLDLIGEVVPFAGNFAPAGNFIPCDGRLLDIGENEALFSVIGVSYGGDGQTSFAVPDLRGRTIEGVGPSDPVPGRPLGQPDISLSNSQTPNGLGNLVQPIDNQEPSLAMNYVIALNGLYPSPGASGPSDNTPALGQIIAFAGGYAPSGYALCNGQLLSIQQYQSLFSLLGTYYGGDGIRTFALPDLRGKVIVGTGNTNDVAGNLVIGETLGSNSLTITSSQLPPNAAPVLTSYGGAATANIVVQPGQTLAATIAASDANGDTLTYTLTGGENASLFTIANGNQLQFVTAPTASAPPLQGATPGYQASVRVSDGHGGYVTQNLNIDLFSAPGGTANYSTQGAGIYADLNQGFAWKETTAGVGWADQNAAAANPNGYTTDTLTNVVNVIGTAYSDRMYGSTGNDLFAPGAGADILYGQGGVDTVDYSELAGGVLADLAAGCAFKETTAGVGWSNPATASSGPNGYWSDSIIGFSNVIGSGFDDRLYGTSGNNVFTPGMGSDYVYGQGGTDTVDYSNLETGVYVDLGNAFAWKPATAGTSWANYATAAAATHASDALIAITNVTGTNYDDRLYGTGGNNVFAPGMGNDIVYGLGGSDTVDYSKLAAGVFVDLGASYARKETTAGVGWANLGTALADGYQSDALIGIANVTGTDFGDRVYAGGDATTIRDGAGNDIIYAGSGVDTIDAGLGANKIVAGSGGGSIVSESATDATGATSDSIIFTGLGNGAYAISGFAHGHDVVSIETNIGGVYDAPLAGAVGTLSGSAFYAGAASTIGALHPATGFAYATDTGALTFWNGGASTALGTITLAGGGALAASDIMLIHG